MTVTFNSAEVLPGFLASLRAQEGADYTLYAIDNASADSSVKQLRTTSGIPIVIVANEDNRGIAEGNNQGIRAAIADGCAWVLLLNNDTEFGPALLNSLLTTASANADAAVTPLISAIEPPHSIWYAGGRLRPYFGMKAIHDGWGQPMPAVQQVTEEVQYASTCALLLPVAAFHQVGLMDPRYFVYGDDVDFCIRAREAGYRYILDRSVELTHKASSLTGGPQSPFTVRWTTRNWVLAARLHCTAPQKAYFSLYLCAWLLARLLTGRDPWHRFRARLAACREAMRVNVMDGAPRL